MSSAKSVPPTHLVAEAPYGPDSKTGGFSEALRPFLQDQAQDIRDSTCEGVILVSTNAVSEGDLYMARLAEAKSVPAEKWTEVEGVRLAAVVSGSVRPSHDPRAGRDPLVGHLLRAAPHEYEFRLDSPTHMPFYLEARITYDPERKIHELLWCSGRADVALLPSEEVLSLEEQIRNNIRPTAAHYPMMGNGSVLLEQSPDGELLIRDTKNPWFWVKFSIPEWMRVRRSAPLIAKEGK